ncbi:MAG: hypothetical protein EXR43_00670 [Dehalococcoidia bacterium]|nr:hypothetical protein [Dehalococcoidia bacterium]
MGLSIALGAFLAGLVIAESEFSYRTLSEVLPLRDVFATVFFVLDGDAGGPGRADGPPGPGCRRCRGDRRRQVLPLRGAARAAGAAPAHGHPGRAAAGAVGRALLPPSADGAE